MQFGKRKADPVALSTATATNPSRAEALIEDHDFARQSSQPTSNNSEEAIRVLAFKRWEAADYPEGDGVEFWLEAEREINETAAASHSADE